MYWLAKRFNLRTRWIDPPHEVDWSWWRHPLSLPNDLNDWPHSGRQLSVLLPPAYLGLKTVENDRENSLIVPVPIFFCREREREQERQTGNRIWYYGISGTEYNDRENIDYDRENINYDWEHYMQPLQRFSSTWGNTRSTYHRQSSTPVGNQQFTSSSVQHLTLGSTSSK